MDPNRVLRVSVVRRGDGYRLWLRTPGLNPGPVTMNLNTGVTVILPAPVCRADACRLGLNINAEQAPLVTSAAQATFVMTLPDGQTTWRVDMSELGAALKTLPREI